MERLVTKKPTPSPIPCPPLPARPSSSQIPRLSLHLPKDKGIEIPMPEDMPFYSPPKGSPEPVSHCTTHGKIASKHSSQSGSRSGHDDPLVIMPVTLSRPQNSPNQEKDTIKPLPAKKAPEVVALKLERKDGLTVPRRNSTSQISQRKSVGESNSHRIKNLPDSSHQTGFPETFSGTVPSILFF